MGAGRAVPWTVHDLGVDNGSFVRRRLWLGVALVVLVVGVAAGVRRCDLKLTPPTAFSYGGHERPRVFVSHHPLIPAPGAELIIRLMPDLPGGVRTDRATAFLSDAAGTAQQSMLCPADGTGGFVCRFSLPTNADAMVYSGRLDLDNGEHVFSRARYRFTAAATLPVDALVEVRVPVKPTADLADTFRVDTAWVRDPLNYEPGPFIEDVEQNLYEGILADPAYRWRDDQLGFSIFTRPGFVTSYYSGRNTRCGKNLWPQDGALPDALNGMEVLGVLHRKAVTRGIEGRITGTVDASLWRDCAGNAVRRPEVGTFSAGAGLTESPLVAKHEFGHAAFGLGDEYSESDATRNVPAAPPLPLSGCCCVVSDGTGGTGTPGTGTVTPGTVTPGTSRITPQGGRVSPRGGTVAPGSGVGASGGGAGTPVGSGTKRCVGPDGTLRESPITALDPASLPACGATNSTIPLDCWSQPDGSCPSLAGDCVAATAWLGQTAPATDTGRPNVFVSQQACNDGLVSATAYPGVEDPTRSLGTCRELCGPNTGPCPCGGREFWIVDLNPGAGVRAPDLTDVMAAVGTDPEFHGGTCTWCVETSLCVRWHRSLGDSAQKTWGACQAPPKTATSFERLWRALLHYIAELLAWIVERVRF